MKENYIREQVVKFLMWRLEGGKKEFDKDLSYNFFCVDGVEIDVYVVNNITKEETRCIMSFPEITKIL